MNVRFSIFNWKWLSDIKINDVKITDPDVQAGLKEGSVEIDFPFLERYDSMGLSKYVAGGRTYYETEISAVSTLFIVGKGFFDKLGYVEPPAPGKSKLGLILGITLPILGAGIGIGLYFYYKKREQKKKKELQHMD